jgi:hypothetical protein
MYDCDELLMASFNISVKLSDIDKLRARTRKVLEAEYLKKVKFVSPAASGGAENKKA